MEIFSERIAGLREKWENTYVKRSFTKKKRLFSFYVTYKFNLLSNRTTTEKKIYTEYCKKD